MKNTLIALACACALLLSACGNSAEDEKEALRAKRVQDSLDSLDSNNSVDATNRLFDSINRADSLAKVKEDSIALAEKSK